MRHYRLDEMRGGWYVGDFQPLAHLWKDGEIAIKHYPKRHTEISYLHEHAKKIYVVLQGCISINGKSVHAGECAIFQEGEDVSLAAMETSTVLLAVIGDKKFTRTNLQSLEQILDVYQPLVNFKRYAGNDISFEDISVVVQGSISERITPLCLESIRKFLPGSKIIVSTWEGENVDSLDADEIVMSKDPGGFQMKLDGIYPYLNNINRQILSTYKGLEKVQTRYALKTRTDSIFLSNVFLKFFCEFSKHGDEYRIFNHKVIVPDLYTRHVFRCTNEYFPTPFHPSDWFMFGELEDVIKYFTLPHVSRAEAVNWRVKYPERETAYKYVFSWRFPPEQHFAIMALRKSGYDIEMEDWTDWNPENIRQSELFIMNNFIVLDFSRTGLYLPKYEQTITSNFGNAEYTEKGLYNFPVYCGNYRAIFETKTEFKDWDVVCCQEGL